MRMRAVVAAGLLALGLAACGGTSTEQKFVNLAIGRDPSGDLDVYVAKDKQDDLVGMGRQVCIDPIDGKTWPIGGNPETPDGKVMSDRAVAAIRSAAQDTLCTTENMNKRP